MPPIPASLICYLPNPTLPSALHPHKHPRPPVRCCIQSPRRTFSSDETSIIEATALVTHHISTSNLTAVTTWQLAAFCNVKNLPLPSNLWDRSALESLATAYLHRERLSRIKRGAEWEALSPSQKIRCLHDVCNAEGDVTYIDPATGYTVFSYFGHLKRGSCCGVKKTKGGEIERIHRCRHCPYDQEGVLRNPKLKALQDRLELVQLAKERAQELYNTGGEVTSFKTENGLAVVEMQPQRAPAVADSTEGHSERGSTAVAREGQALAERFAKVVRRERKVVKEGVQCAACGDERYVTCTRCRGWTFLVSPQMMKCPQCAAKGYHPCMECTPFRPPSRSSFNS